ncbi:MAG: hypothetical protein V1745_00135 [Patescibacteria group bacterium]
MNRNAPIRFLLSASVATLTLNACRSEEGLPVYDEHRDAIRDETESTPDTEREPQRFLDPPAWTDEDRGPDTLPSASDVEETFATDVWLTPGCDTLDGIVPVTARHEHESSCETLHALAVMGTPEGDTFQVGAYFLWASLHPDIISPPVAHGSMRDLSSLHANQDVFDMGGTDEPTSTVIACAVNDCPTDGSDVGLCQEMACATATVASVVNLEGTWSLTGPTIPSETIFDPIQHGRDFSDTALDVWRGRIHGAVIRFEIGDYQFDGHILSDRNTLSGTVTELMTYSAIGPWSATRISP